MFHKHPLYCFVFCFSHVLTPFGMWVGVKEKKFVKASPNPVLEKYYVKNGMKKANNNNNNSNNNLEVLIKLQYNIQLP